VEDTPIAKPPAGIFNDAVTGDAECADAVAKAATETIPSTRYTCIEQFIAFSARVRTISAAVPLGTIAAKIAVVW
jgi:hypothetical protein